MATEKARVPGFVLTLGTESKSEPDNRNCLSCLAGVSIECKYAGYVTHINSPYNCSIAIVQMCSV